MLGRAFALRHYFLIFVVVQTDVELVQAALRSSFLAVDAELRSLCNDGSGTTAVAVFLTPTHIFVANCGM